MQKIYRIILSLIILSNCVGVMQAQEKNVARRSDLGRG